MNDEKATTELTHDEAITALERFVVDNDELLELEERIGRFNIFDALGVVRQEIRHSNFLAWLLDPAESHGQGQLFLKAILMDLLRQAPPDQRPLSPVNLDGNDLGGVRVRREWRNLDLLVEADDPKIAIAIENKIDASEHSNQLTRYRDTVQSAFPSHRRMFVFLTPEGDEPSEEDWTIYTYGDIHRVLHRCMRLNQDSIGDEVAAFLSHYLSLVKGRLMDDPVIDDLCERIYRNHRQAVEMLMERVGDPRSRVVRAVRDTLSADQERWFVEGDQSVACRFLPRQWLSFLPPINSRPQQHPNAWVFATIRMLPKRVHFAVTIGPTTDTEIRSSLIDAIRSDSAKKHGFKLSRKESGERWAKVYGQSLLTDRGGVEYSDEVADVVLKHLPDIESRLTQMGDFLESTLSK